MSDRSTVLRAPFPWFGGKSRVADIVWSRFGNVTRYIEPFGGSAAVLLARPVFQRSSASLELLNDLDGFVANFWRSVQYDPDTVAFHAAQPVFETELHAWNKYLIAMRPDLAARLDQDVRYYDAEVAGRWCWGQCIGIGDMWCKALPGGGVERSKPNVMHGHGVKAKQSKPNLQSPRGIQTAWNCKPVVTREIGVTGEETDEVTAWMYALHERIHSVKTFCGDWKRTVTPAVLFPDREYKGVTALFLDPPYSAKDRDSVYAFESYDVAHTVRDWAIANGNEPRLRIAYCGYDDMGMPDGWTEVRWAANGGYANHGERGRGRANARRERIWFSPHCQLPDADRPLMRLMGA